MHREVFDVNRVDACMRRTLPDQVQHALHLVRRALDDGLDGAVAPVADSAAKTASVALDKRAKSNHLHAAAHNGTRSHEPCLHDRSICAPCPGSSAGDCTLPAGP